MKNGASVAAGTPFGGNRSICCCSSSSNGGIASRGHVGNTAKPYIVNPIGMHTTRALQFLEFRFIRANIMYTRNDRNAPSTSFLYPLTRVSRYGDSAKRFPQIYVCMYVYLHTYVYFIGDETKSRFDLTSVDSVPKFDFRWLKSKSIYFSLKRAFDSMFDSII